MLDSVVTVTIMAVLLFMLGFKSKYIPSGNEGFFDIQNSKAMRGFWCLIVLLVHVPQAYQNAIQDMVGSFAYIGVTFFFMSSAFGLSLSVMKKSGTAKQFWIARLPKLLVPNWIVNIVFSLLFLIMWGERISFSNILAINPWLVWLLECYVILWIAFYLNRNEHYRVPIICILVCVLSLSVYFLQHINIIKTTTWCTEVYGFIWGLILCFRYEKIKRFLQTKWIAKAIGFCALSLLLGVAYLRLKPVFFWGNYILKIVLGVSILGFILLLNARIQIGNKFIWFLGDISYEVYLVHVYVFKLIELLVPGMSSGMFIFTSIVSSILLSAVIHKLSGMILGKLNGLAKKAAV